MSSKRLCDGSAAHALTVDGQTFRDLNKNGQLDIYEDRRQPVDARVEDLLSQMTLAEKVGMMFYAMAGIGPGGSLLEEGSGFSPGETTALLTEKLINHCNVFLVPSARDTATWYNNMQTVAESTRLGIPVTIASDPRHGVARDMGVATFSGPFSKWPDPIGFAALNDTETTEQFADIARQEYLAVGIRTALHPMADLATEPRWARISGTFGEDAELSSRMVYAYVRGFQGDEIGPHSVTCMTKHFPGGGPQMDGLDAHFPFGAEQVYPGDNFDYHMIPFGAAFEAGTGQIMPYYGKPMNTEWEEVGFGFNKGILQTLLRGRFGFKGVICTDWGLLNDNMMDGQLMLAARAWGVEHLTPSERALKAIEAGIDQFGGEACPDLITDLVKGGKVSEARIDESARRLLRDKFRLGLFDDPYVDPAAAESTVGAITYCAAGLETQKRAMVLLKNGKAPSAPVLPLKSGIKLYVEGVDVDVAADYAQVVERVEDADIALLRLTTPYEPGEGFFAGMFHQGDLDFKGVARDRIMAVLDKVPTIVDIYMDRPAVIPEIAEACAGLFANFGASDAAALDVIFGKAKPEGKLPIEMPRSMEAVRVQKEDLAYDSDDPLYPFGYGLSYD